MANERGTDDRGVSPQSRGLAAAPRLHPRCASRRLLVPATYSQLEKVVKEWIGTCVMSRTPVRGVPIRREQELLHDNASLAQVWALLSPLVGQYAQINAEYTWGDNRVEAVRFSLPASSISIEPEHVVAAGPPKPRYHSVQGALARASLAVSKLEQNGGRQYGGTGLEHLYCLARTAGRQDFDDRVILAEKFNSDMPALMRGQLQIGDLLSSFLAFWRNSRLDEDDAIVLDRPVRLSDSIGQVMDFVRREEAKNTAESMNKSLLRLKAWIVARSREPRSVYHCYALK